MLSACRPSSFDRRKPTRDLIRKNRARIVKVDGACRQTPPKPCSLPCALLGRSCREEPAGAGADCRPDGAKRAGRGPQRGAVHCGVDCGGQASGRFESRAVPTEEKANGAKRASGSGLVGEFVSQKVSRKVSPDKFWKCLLQNAQLPEVPALLSLVKRGSDPHLFSNSHRRQHRSRLGNINPSMTAPILVLACVLIF